MKDAEQLVTIEELAKIMEYVTAREIIEAKTLADEWIATTEQHESDAKWNYDVLLTAIYSAGRVQGMREVRLKNKHIKQLP